MIIYCIVTAFLNVLGGVVLGTSVLLRSPRRFENHLFAWFAASTAAWSFFYLLWQLAPVEETALFYARLLTGASIFIPISYFHFASRLTGRSDLFEIRAGYGAAALIAAFTLSPYLVAEVEPELMFAYWPKPGPFFVPYIITFLYYTARSWMILFDALSKATHWRRRQLGYVCFGTVFGWAGGLTNFFLWVGIPIPPIGNGLALVYIVSVGYALMRFRLVDINVFVVKGVIYLIMVSVMALLYVLFSGILIGGLPDTMGHLANVAEYVAAFLGILALFVFAPPLARRIDAFLEERALGGLIEERHRLREHIRHISTLSGLPTIFEETVTVVSESLRGARVEIFCRNEFAGDYAWQAGSHVKRAFSATPLTDEDWLVKTARSSGKAVVVYEQELSEDIAEDLAKCSRAGIDIAIPIHAERLFYGLLLCGSRTDRRLYSDLDISLLEAVCTQIGLTIRARELERRSNRTEKLISLGTLAAGLAHELRNPLVSIRTFVELIRDQGDDPEFRKQFSGVVDRDVDRIGSIIDQVAAFASNADTSFAPVEITRVVRDLRDIAGVELKRSGVAFQIEEADVPKVHGNYNQLIQVFLNLLQNAIQAFDGMPDREVRVSFASRIRKDGNKVVVVAVADNGPGIPAGIRGRIFDPFVTTKNTGPEGPHRGMGLGLGIVKSIIEAHGGSIEFATTAGSGTTFYVELLCDEDNKVVHGESRREEGAEGADVRSGGNLMEQFKQWHKN